MEGIIFLLEDDTSISSLIKVALEMNNFEFYAFKTKSEFLSALEKKTPDVALLDIMLPDGSGLDALKVCKERYHDVSCIILSALSQEEDKVNGLNLGADDYITKPFSVLELIARVKARLRNKHRTKVLSVGEITLNIDTMLVTFKNEPLSLNKKEFELLKYFMENHGKVLSRDKLLIDIWGYDTGETRTLDNHVARLRKLGIPIETIFGVGYRL